MDAQTVRERLLAIIHEVRPGIDLGDNSLFSVKVNCSPTDAVYILLKIREAFGIHIDDCFVEGICDMTVFGITEAIMKNRGR